MSLFKILGGFGFIDYVKKSVKYLGNINYDDHRKENTANGTGIICYPNGALYFGGVSNNNTLGNGIRFCPDGTLVMGDFLTDGANGHGYIKYPDGTLYEGDIDKNQPNGQGKMYFPGGIVYECHWGMGKPVHNPLMFPPKIYSLDMQVYYFGQVSDQFVPHGSGVLRRGERWFDGKFENGILKNGVYQIGKHCIYQERVTNWGSLMCEGPPKESTLDISTVVSFGISKWFSKPGIEHLGDPGVRFLDEKHPLYQALAVAMARNFFRTTERYRVFVDGTSTQQLRGVSMNVNPTLKKRFDFSLLQKMQQWEAARLNPIEKATAILAPLWHGTKSSQVPGLMNCERTRGIFEKGFITCLSGTSTGSAYGAGSYFALPNKGDYSLAGNYTSSHIGKKPDGTNDFFRSILACVGAVGTSKPNPIRKYLFPDPDDTFIDKPWDSLHHGGPEMCIFQDGSLVYPLANCFFSDKSSISLEAKKARENLVLEGEIAQMGRELAEEIKTWDRQDYEIERQINATFRTPYVFVPMPPVKFGPLSPLPVVKIGDKTYTSIKFLEPRVPTTMESTTLGKRSAPDTTIPEPPPTRLKSAEPAAMTIDLTDL